MDEPMEDVNARTNESSENKTNNPQAERTQTNRILPGSSMVMINMCKEEYEVHYWPKLESAIQQLLTLTPGEYVPISYEQMYSCVYKCVCKQFSERLYSDLAKHIEDHLKMVSMDLQNVESSVYITKFHSAMTQYEQALGGIVPIFNYMNRFYVENKLHSDLKTELERVFTTVVADNHIEKLIPLLKEAQAKPFLVGPGIMANLIKGLYNLKPGFVQLSPELFAKYIPNVLPPMDVAELPQYVAETQQIQQQMIEEGIARGDQSRKRRSENDMPTPSESAATQNSMNRSASDDIRVTVKSTWMCRLWNIKDKILVWDFFVEESESTDLSSMNNFFLFFSLPNLLTEVHAIDLSS